MYIPLFSSLRDHFLQQETNNKTFYGVQLKESNRQIRRYCFAGDPFAMAAPTFSEIFRTCAHKYS